MKTIVLAFFASASLTAWGQSYKVAGTVLDAKSKVPVEFATLWIEGSGIGSKPKIFKYNQLLSHFHK